VRNLAHSPFNELYCCSLVIPQSFTDPDPGSEYVAKHWLLQESKIQSYPNRWNSRRLFFFSWLLSKIFKDYNEGSRLHLTKDVIFQEYMGSPQTLQTAYLPSQGGLRRPKLTRHDMLRSYYRFLECHLTATCWTCNTHSGVKFYNF